MHTSLDQARNLDHLATALETLPEGYLHFDMETYYHNPKLNLLTEADEIEAAQQGFEVFGSCGCIIGHAPSNGLFRPGFTSWSEYASEMFGVDETGYSYLFGGEWAFCDNTPIGAARRIRTYLALGGAVPEHFLKVLSPAPHIPA